MSNEMYDYTSRHKHYYCLLIEIINCDMGHTIKISELSELQTFLWWFNDNVERDKLESLVNRRKLTKAKVYVDYEMQKYRLTYRNANEINQNEDDDDTNL